MSTDASELEATVPTQAADREFHVRCERSANWAVRQIVEARAYRRRVADWTDRETRRAQRRERFLLLRFGPELEDWARQRIAAAGDKRRSVSLPAGVVGLRVERPRLVVRDESALVRWCRQHLPSSLQTVERVLKRPLKEHFEATGELPEGAEMRGGGEKFYVK